MAEIEWEVRGCEDYIVDGETHTHEVPDDVADFFSLYTRDHVTGLMFWYWDFPTREEAEAAGRELVYD